jgi:branched-subunit amino acid ABC-type transport system permease component
MSTILAAGFATGCLTGLVAVAIVMIARTSGVVNFAQGEFMTIAAYFYIPYAARSTNSAETLIIVVLIGAVMGAVFFAITEIFLARATLLIQMMATFALSLLIISILINVKGDQTLPVSGWYKSSSLFYVFATHISGQEIIEVIATFAIVTALNMIMRFTNLGKDIEAVSENRKAANLCGISPRSTIAFSWMVGGAITAFAGILYAPLAGVTPQMGANLLFPAFVAATIGGFSSVTGAAAGGIGVGLVVSLANHFLGGSISTVAVFVVLELSRV